MSRRLPAGNRVVGHNERDDPGRVLCGGTLVGGRGRVEFGPPRSRTMDPSLNRQRPAQSSSISATRRPDLGRHRQRRLRDRQRQRWEGRAGVDRRLLHQRRRLHRPAPGPLHGRPVQTGVRRLPHARLGGRSGGVPQDALVALKHMGVNAAVL